MKGQEMSRQSWVRTEWVAVVTLVSLMASVGYAEGKPWSRALRGELYPAFQMLGSDAVTADHGVMEIEMGDSPTFGAGMGFNLNDHLNINTEILFGSMDMTARLTLAPEIETDLTLGVFLWNVNLDYNIFESRLTPLITGGGGLLRVHEGDERISETHASGNVGAGIRWDMSDRLALRVIYRWTWTEFEDMDDPFEFDGVAASLIFMFK